LVLVDERGHGKSDKPHDVGAYGTECRIADMTSVLDDLGIYDAHLMGYSYGGRIALECARAVPDRVLSAVIGGMGPQGKSHDGSNPTLKMFENGPEAVISMLERSGPLPARERAEIMQTDFKALVAVVSSPWPNLEADLPCMFMPFLIFLGEHDHLWPPEMVNKAYGALPNATFLVLPGLDHRQAARRSDLVLPHIKKFLARVSKTQI
jgi:pimeloyl-ACP methyl ester carboxylesterase